MNKGYFEQKNLEEAPLTLLEFCLKLKEIWYNSEKIKVRELTLFSIMRSIWSLPLTKCNEDFGEIQRITKEGVIRHSPFFYGPLNDDFYCDLLRGVGDYNTGIRLVRRVVDHAAHYNHVPSIDMINTIIDECMAGKWPRAMYTAIQYSCKQNVEIPNKIWISVLNFFRFYGDFYYMVDEILTLALENGATPCFELIHLYVARSYENIDEKGPDGEMAHVKLLKKMKDSIVTLYPSKEERLQKTSDLMLKYIKFLISINETKEANEVIQKYIEEDNYSLESIEVCFKAYEEIKDPFKATRIYKQITNHPNFIFTPKIVVAILRMCSVLGKSAEEIIKDIEDLIIKDKNLCTPFAVNTIIISHSVADNFDSVIHFMGKCFQYKIPLNKFTGPTIRKMSETCTNESIKSKLFEQAAKADMELGKTN